MTNTLLKIAVCATFLLPSPAFSAEWGVVGVGNATCEHWGQADTATKKQIIAWMQGFATSESLSRTAAGSAEFRLELLTSEYLDAQINTVCSPPQNKHESMSGIFIDILAKFPTH